MWPRSHRVDRAGKSPPSADAAPRASGKRTLKHPGDGGAPLPGNRTRRQELADRRGWSTFSKARPGSRKTPPWSAGRRLAPHKGARGRLRKASHRMVSPAIHRGSRTPPRLPALRSPRGSADEVTRKRACPGPTKEYGRSRMPALGRALTKAVVSRGPVPESLPTDENSALHRGRVFGYIRPASGRGEAPSKSGHPRRPWRTAGALFPASP